MFQPQVLAIFRLYKENLSISYTCICRGCVGCRGEVSVRDLASACISIFWDVTNIVVGSYQNTHTALKMEAVGFSKMVGGYKTKWRHTQKAVLIVSAVRTSQVYQD